MKNRESIDKSRLCVLAGHMLKKNKMQQTKMTRCVALHRSLVLLFP